MKRYLIYGLAGFLVVGGFGWLLATAPSIPEEEIISKNGLHWHASLVIRIEGESQDIPANIGLVVVHNPIHTHDSSGVIHMEFEGLVAEDNLKLGQFFNVWNKQFNANCVFEFCNGSEGSGKMSVNGESNTEFENYLMKDGDKIEIRYE